MAGATETGGNVAMIQGSAILLLAAFMPFALLRVIPIMEGAVSAEGMARGVGTKAAMAGYGAAKVGGAISGTASSASGSVRSRWDNRNSVSTAASTNEDANPAAGSGGSERAPTTSGESTGPRSTASEGTGGTSASGGTSRTPSGNPTRTGRSTTPSKPEHAGEEPAVSSTPPPTSPTAKPSPSAPTRPTPRPPVRPDRGVSEPSPKKPPATNDDAEPDEGKK